MADLDTEAPKGQPDAVPSATPSRWTAGRRTVLAVVAAVLVVGGVAAAVIANRDDGPSYDTAQIGWIHEGCQQWSDNYQGSNGPGEGWCTSMTDWMNAGIGQAHGRMMGPITWQPDSIRTTCQHWIADDPVTASGRRAEWCDQMVDWMNEHTGDWDQWMDDGPRMGRP